MPRARGQFDQIVPVRDEFFGRLDEGVKAIASKPDVPDNQWADIWEIARAPKPELKMKMERSDTNGRSK